MADPDAGPDNQAQTIRPRETTMRYDKIQEILATATSGSYDLDQQFWSLHEGHG